MKNFLRALKQASRYWPSLVMATACSFAVAALWGANIGAFLPILKVTIQGKSLHQYIAEETLASEKKIQFVSDQIAQQQLVIEQTPGDTTAVDRLAELGFQRDAETAKLVGYQKAAPWLQRFVPDDPFETIALIVAVLILSTAIKHVFLIANEYMVGRVALNISRNLRMQIFDKAMRMDRASYATHGSGGFSAQITHTTEMLSGGLMNALGAAIREPLKVTTCLIGAGMICWRLLLMSVVIAPLVGWMLVAVTRRIKGISQRILTKAAGFHEVMHESLGNIQTVQAYRMEDRELERFGEATEQMKWFGLKFIFYSSLTKPIIEFLGLGMLGTTIIGGAYLVLKKETHLLGIQVCNTPLSVEGLLVFFGFLIGVSDPLRKLSAVYGSVYAGTIAADSLYGVLDHCDKIQDPKAPSVAPSPHRVLSLNQIEFGYQPEQRVLNRVSLDIPFGSTVAIVGHNGCGKSTLINLLCRFYDPHSGSLTLDGVDFRHQRVDDIRKRIALVNQHTELFNETVAYNIKYGKPQASREDVERFAKEAHAYEFIAGKLESGFDTIVGHNGQRLSGGQRQRIALARALLCDPEILILDEATSQIDMQSEQLIRESLARHRGERTMIIITHREKLLELADRVFEMKDGNLVEISQGERSVA